MDGIISNTPYNIFLKFTEDKWIEWWETQWRKYRYFKESTDRQLAPMELIEWKD